MHESAARLYAAALAALGVSGQSALARKLNESPQVLKNWESRGVSKQGALKVAPMLGIDVSWLLYGPGVQPPQEGQNEPIKSHPVTLDVHTVPVLTWEELMDRVNELGQVFTVALRDAALAPEYPAGTKMTFDRRIAPQPEDVVLVRTAAGELHARVYAQGKAPGQWSSTAMRPAFASFGAEDGAECLAVMVEALIPAGRRAG